MDNQQLTADASCGSLQTVANGLRMLSRRTRDPVIKSHCAIARTALARLAADPNDTKAKAQLSEAVTVLEGRG